jgi:competence protein ComEC
MWIYALLTGLSPSVLRAVFMFTVLVLAQLSGKNHNSINALFFTAFTLFLFDPYTLFDIGFQLSFLAMLGIFLFYRPIEQLIFIENKLLRKVWQGTAIGFAAQLMTTPLSLYYFHQFPNYFVLTNIGLMASSGLILGFGIFIFSVSWLKPVAKIAGLFLGYIIFISLWFIEWVEGLPGAVAYGFELSIMVVLLMGVLALYMFLDKSESNYYRYSYVFASVLLGAVIWKRYDNLSEDQLCVFNSKQLLITVKKGDRIFCFYNADQEDFAKVKFNVESYRKLFPGNVLYLPVADKNYSIQSKGCKVQVVKEDGGYSLMVNSRKFFVSFYNTREINSSELSIGMPWIESGVDHPLFKGAFISSL